MDIPERFSSGFAKENNFPDRKSPPYNLKPFKMEATLKEHIYSQKSKFFLLLTAPNEKRGKQFLDRIISLGDVAFPLKYSKNQKNGVDNDTSLQAI